MRLLHGWTGPESCTGPHGTLANPRVCSGESKGNRNTKIPNKWWILQDRRSSVIKRLAAKCEDGHEGREFRAKEEPAPLLTLAGVWAHRWAEISSVGDQFKFTAEETLVCSYHTQLLQMFVTSLFRCLLQLSNFMQRIIKDCDLGKKQESDEAATDDAL